MEPLRLNALVEIGPVAASKANMQSSDQDKIKRVLFATHSLNACERPCPRSGLYRQNLRR